jgi:hypothetical protein
MADTARHVSIIFCGGCNPGIDRGSLAAELARRLAAMDCRLSYNDRTATFSSSSRLRRRLRPARRSAGTPGIAAAVDASTP